jgi:hypothetical protein
VRALVDLPFDEPLVSACIDLAILERRDQRRDRALEGRHWHEIFAPNGERVSLWAQKITAGNRFWRQREKMSRLAVRWDALRSFGNNQSTSRLAGVVVRRRLNAYFHRLNRRLRPIAATLQSSFRRIFSDIVDFGRLV